MATMKFSYLARNEAGREVKGTIEAENEADVTGQLRQRGLSVVGITRKAEKMNKEIKLFGEAAKKASTKDLALFTRQLSTMLGAGIPLLEGLEVLAEQTMETNQGFGQGAQEVADMVRGGTSLSEAMTQYPKIFPDIYINMIKAGEASGQLDVILDRLAEYMEASEELKSEIKSAMTYPVISLVLVLGITGYLLVGVVPKFEKMFLSLGAELPPVTVAVLAASKFCQANWYFFIIGAVAAVVGLKVGGKNPKFAYAMDTVKLKMPVFGPLSQKVAVSRFARTFGTLLSSGVPILGALEIVATTSGNKVIEDAVMETRETVRSGDSITSHLQECWVFPPMVVRMIAIGERSGALETLLNKISEFYDQQVHVMVKSLTSLIEPIMIAIMGVIVGTIVLAIFWPILELQKNLM